ncbi:YdcF family protein [Fibrella sp. WM1]|uniref:YdcF family protein n=1 Tax=Fibrella musci TaxID=3242485 RepID=UPI00352028D8
MFYVLSKSIGYFLTPAGWLLGTLVGAWLLPRYRRRLVGTSLLLFWVLGNSYLVYNQLAPRWEVNPTQPLPQPVQGQPVVAVVLTGGMINTKLPVTPARPLLGQQADRLGQALYLYKTGRAQKILISGGESGLFFYGTSAVQEGQAAMQFLHLAGIPTRDLLWETRSRNTQENALFSARLLRQHYKTSQCVVVTSAFHMRRALACFAREGITATPFAGSYMQQPGQLVLADVLVPHEQAFADAMHLIKELVGYVTYAAMGYV